MSKDATSGSGPKAPARKIPRWMTALVVLAVFIGLYFLFQDTFQATFGWIQGKLKEFAYAVKASGPWGPVIFILGYAALTVALIPGSFLTLVAGFIFGLVQGVAYVMIGASLGAAGGFLVARYVARSYVERRLAGNESFSAVDRAIGKQGLKITALLRLSPVFPFSFLNYALGLTKVRFLHFNLASLAMIPGSLLYVYYGKIGGDISQLASSGAKGESGGWQDWAVRIVGLIATIAVTTVVTRTARKALREATEQAASVDVATQTGEALSEA